VSVSYRRLATALVAAVLAVTASVAYAQRIWVGGGRFYRTAPKWATPANFDGSFNFCRAFYTSDRREDGGSGWDTDFPGADNNFSVRLAELTFVRVRLDHAGQPDYVVLRLTDPLLALSALGTLAANVLARAVARGVYAAEALPYPGALPDWNMYGSRLSGTPNDA